MLILFNFFIDKNIGKKLWLREIDWPKASQLISGRVSASLAI